MIRRIPSGPIARSVASVVLSAFVLLIGADGGAVLAQDAKAKDAVAQAGPPRPLDVPYVPTPQDVVDTMLRLGNVGRRDFLIDLGCGDGRIPVTAASRFGTRGFGVDLNPVRVKEAKENAAKSKVGKLVEFVQGDLFETDISKATVITMYLLPSVNMKLRPFVLNLKPGTRIVSHDFSMGDWQPDKVEKLDYKTVYYWMVPAKVAGRYELRIGRETIPLVLEQKFQMVSGTATIGDKKVDIVNGKLAGANISFEIPMPDGKTRKIEGNAFDLGKLGGRGWWAQRI